MLSKILGTASFKAEGENIYSFINCIRENGLCCMSQRCNNGAFYGCIYTNSIKKLSELAKEHGVTLTFSEKRGAPIRLYKYRFRWGIITGLLLLLALVFYLSNIVVSVEICGNRGVTDEQIITALSDIGIYKGRFIADINFRSCEQRLRLSVPEIAWAGIRHTGSRIVVDVTEVNPPPEMIRDDIPCNVVADRDAQILSAEVYSGKLAKSVGSGVEKGDIIISGLIDDGGGHVLKKHAMGKIIARYNEQVCFSQPLSSNTQVYKGKEVTKKYFNFFGFRIPLFLRDAEFESYDYLETENKFMLFGNELPLGIVHSSYKPFEYQTAAYSVSEAEELLRQRLAVYEKNFYDAGNIEVEKRDIEVKSFSDKIEYNVSYTLVGEIGQDYEIFID